MCLVSPINKKSIIILIFRIIKQSTQMFRLHHHRIQISMKKREVIFTKEGHGLLSYNDDSGSGDQREPAGVDAGKWQIDNMWW